MTSSEDPGSIIQDLGSKAKESLSGLRDASVNQINAVLKDIASELETQISDVLTANKKDIEAAQKSGKDVAFLDRLALDEGRIKSMAESLRAIAALEDPTGKVLWETTRPNGLKIKRVSCPIGVLGIIYESRPNVTVDAAALCLKSRNAVILRGGSESLNSAAALHWVIARSLSKSGLSPHAAGLIPVSDRAVVGAMLKAHRYIDVMIPRGGKNLIKRVMEEATMPVFSHLDGICHTFIHRDADPDKAATVTLNAKMRRTGICGATETILLDSGLKPDIARAVIQKLIESGCALRGDKMAQQLDERITPATAEDWNTEYLDAIASICVVNDIGEAIAHINTHGSHHTDAIITENDKAAVRFLNDVDSGIVMHNASTQFADGGEFGLGAEIGIATGKLHARGPVGLEQLCSYKYMVYGEGQIRS